MKSLLLRTGAYWLFPFLLLGGLVLPYGKGPQAGSTNAPGESACQAAKCHAQEPLNSGPGNLLLTGVPETWLPGKTYPLTVSLQQKGQKRWGFQLTALDQSGHSSGTLQTADTTLVRLIPGERPDSSIRQYMEHTKAGTFMGRGDGPVQWEFEWQAPQQHSGPVYFYTAANAANFNKKPWGDYIYTRIDTAAGAATE